MKVGEKMNERIYNKERKELITLKEAEELGYGQADTLKMRIHAGTLRGIKKGKTWFVIKYDVKKESKN